MPALPPRELRAAAAPGIEICSNDPKGSRHACCVTLDDEVPVAKMKCGHYISAGESKRREMNRRFGASANEHGETTSSRAQRHTVRLQPV